MGSYESNTETPWDPSGGLSINNVPDVVVGAAPKEQGPETAEVAIEENAPTVAPYEENDTALPGDRTEFLRGHDTSGANRAAGPGKSILLCVACCLSNCVARFT